MCTLRVSRFHPASWNKAGLPTPIDDSSWPSSIWHIGGIEIRGSLLLAKNRLAVQLSYIFALCMVLNRFIQDFKNHIGGHLVFGRIFLWLVQHTHTIVSEHLKTSVEGRMTIKAPSGTKARDSDNWHLQPGIFTQDAGGQRIRDAQRPLVDRVECCWEDNDSTGSG